MYTGKGGGSNPIVPIAATLGASTVLPRTGMNTALQIALAAAVGLAVWAVVYIAMAKFSKR
jgi:hypothetical protein